VEESSSVVKFNPLDVKVLIELMEDGPPGHYYFLDSKKKMEEAKRSKFATLWETVSDINKSRISLKNYSESTIRSSLERLKRNDFVEEEKLETKTRSKGAVHYRIARGESESKKLIRELFSHLSDGRVRSWPQIGFELLRTPWMRWALSPDFIKSELIRRGLHVDEIDYIKSNEALYVMLQCTPSGLIRFLREDLWSPTGSFGKSWKERKYPTPISDDAKRDLCMNPIESLIHYLTFDIISDLHEVRCVGGVSPFEIRCEQYYVLHHHPLSVLKASVGAMMKSKFLDVEISNSDNTTFSAFTVDGSQLSIHAFFDSEGPAIIGGEDGAFIEIGGDKEDVYASFRWLERDQWYYNNWKSEYDLN